MAVLKAAGVVESHRRGRWVHHAIREDLAPHARRLLEAV
jgi:hypothetical protein